MKFQNLSQAKKLTGLSYLGSVGLSSKMAKGLKYNEATYILYLAPAKSSGYEVCPMRTAECTLACLNESGRNKIDIKENRINQARIKKTKMFFEDREFFMGWLIDEITKEKAKAEKAGLKFSVRLNGTSDLDPTTFKLDDKNILEWFSEVPFYDYTKVSKRFRLLEKYPNYDLTFSFSGHNMDECIELLTEGKGRVAMVFEGNKLPIKWREFEVIDGDAYDMRYIDETGVIVGLKFKKVRNKIEMKNNKFIIPMDSPLSIYENIQK
jgi:hypothetical protein